MLPWNRCCGGENDVVKPAESPLPPTSSLSYPGKVGGEISVKLAGRAWSDSLAGNGERRKEGAEHTEVGVQIFKEDRGRREAWG